MILNILSFLLMLSSTGLVISIWLNPPPSKQGFNMALSFACLLMIASILILYFNVN